MANICDYLLLRGDVTLGERPFNDVDNLILSTFSYLDLAGVVDDDGPALTLSLVCEKLLELTGGTLDGRVRSLANITPEFVRLLAASDRFGGALVRDYVDVRQEEPPMQFSAVTIELDGGQTYVAFRGTDSTLVGWREDFILSFAVTGAQRAAEEYLERAVLVAQSRGRRVLVGGHSKGGNLACFAAATLPEVLRTGVWRVWSNDGPGMAREVMPHGAFEVYGERYVRIVPQYSVVGMCFDDGAPYVVAKSSASHVMQHDPCTWQVTATGIDEADCLDPEARLIDEAFSSWLSGLDLADRELLTNELFDALAAGGAQTLDDITHSASDGRRVLAALASVDVRTREMVRALLAALAESTKTATLDAMSVAANDVATWATDGLAKLAESAKLVVINPKHAAGEGADDGDNDRS